MKILIVDADDWLLLNEYLQTHGFKLAEAFKGKNDPG